MISLNKKVIDIKKFPDGTILMKEDLQTANTKDLRFQEMEITWKYENDRELLALVFLARHIQDLGYENIVLFLPYVPNARQDRVQREKNNEDVFTLKYFTEIINSLHFNKVYVLDAHSKVTLELIKNVIALTPFSLIDSTMVLLSEKLDVEPIKVFPDKGAAERYSICSDGSTIYGIKERKWDTGEIVNFSIETNGTSIEGKDAIIIDDICSYGGTFYYTALKLKEMGAKDIYIFCTHCEHNIFKGKLLNSELIKMIFTTDSIYGNFFPNNFFVYDLSLDTFKTDNEFGVILNHNNEKNSVNI